MATLLIEKIRCFIKNFEWKNNSSNFIYKLTEMILKKRKIFVRANLDIESSFNSEVVNSTKLSSSSYSNQDLCCFKFWLWHKNKF